MIERQHITDSATSWAQYSDCERYRYSLTRLWDPAGKRLLYIMLNPSKATEMANDPTIERCERRARALGYGAFRVCNLFALRETDPALLRKATAPEGPQNAACLQTACDWSDTVLCGWGVHGEHLGQGPMIATQLRARNVALYHLGLTKHGHPRHPLYVAYATRPQPWE